ncbi:MAG: sugar phosphate isomerase/epimerase [Lentisphaeria bacterium]|nr:sugar phosphate isomerase/epimerase [Lentisphaeria bacterium]
MNVGVSTYSFSRLIRSGEMTQSGAVAKTKEMGFDSVEICDIHAEGGVSEADYARRLRDEAAALSLPIASYTFGANLLGANDHYDPQAEIARVKQQVDIAALLGAPLVRHDAFGSFPADYKGLRGFHAVLPLIADSCREITRYAADKGIVTTVENHGHICQDSLRMEELVTAVNHSNFGLTIDIGNFGGVDDDSAIAVGRLAPFARHCHAKDSHIKAGTEIFPGRGWRASRGGTWRRAAIIGHGNVPVAQCVRILAAKGYTGALSIEYEGIEDVLMGISMGQENLRRYIAMTAG